MKPILVILVLTVAISLNVGAQDVRSKVGPASGTSLTNIIDPDNSVYGAQWGSSEDEFISKFGQPTGKRYYFEIGARITGSSKGGGPLFNGEGEVIGILGERLKETDRLLAIPASYLKTLLQYRNVGASAGAGESGAGTLAAGGNPVADGPVSVGPGEEKSAGGSNAGPERNNPASASVDTKPLLLNNPPPRYTEEARQNKTQGAVNVAILAGEDGKVKQARVTKGLPDGLNEQALTAAHQMRFKPATLNGQAVSYPCSCPPLRAANGVRRRPFIISMFQSKGVLTLQRI